jgi:hypothetical protein
MKTAALPVLVLVACGAVTAAEPRWRHLSTATRDLPPPGGATEQTAAVVADLDGDGTNDFVIATRKVAPAVIWYRRVAAGWDRLVVEPDMLTVEAGGAAFDIDRDGDLDLLFGGDADSDQVWWWENPRPRFEQAVRWTRHLVKHGGARQHHDQVFADLLGTGTPQLAFWNQGAKTLFLADIPPDPRTADEWPRTAIFSGAAGEPGSGGYAYAEGAAVVDVDGDGVLDLLAGNLWFKHRGGRRFDAIRIGTDSIGGRIAAGRFEPGKYPQIVIAPGDGVGPLRLYKCVGDPARTSDWIGRDLAGRDLIHGHSLAIADVDCDGHLDIFAAEMAKWSDGAQPDNPKATAWIFYGDGRGGFRRTVFQTGVGFHEARLADLDGDGRMDVLSKPYTWEAPRIDVWLQGDVK